MSAMRSTPSPRSASGLRASCLAAALVLSACGAAAPAVLMGSPFSADDTRLFGNGVDFVADPAALEGRWRQEWSDDLQGRIGSADAVATVTVHTLRTDVDPGRRTTYRLIVGVDRVLVGDLGGEDLTLTSGEVDPGFRTIAGNDHRLLQQPFIAFLKWERGLDDVTPILRFHLSPATDPVARRVAYLLERRRGVEREQTRPRVIVRRN